MKKSNFSAIQKPTNISKQERLYTEAKLSFAPIAIQIKKAAKSKRSRKKIRLIYKASFKTKTR